MPESLPSPTPPPAESYFDAVEKTAFGEVLTARNNVDDVLKEMGDVLRSHPIEEAEKIILETIAPRLEAAQREAKRAVDDWLLSLEEHRKSLGT